MTDAHCHVSCGDPSVRELLIGRDFIGVHPWAVAVGNQGATEACGVPEATRLAALTRDRNRQIPFSNSNFQLQLSRTKHCSPTDML